MKRRWSNGVVLVACALVVSLLAGCSDDDAEPALDRSSTGRASSTVAPATGSTPASTGPAAVPGTAPPVTRAPAPTAPRATAGLTMRKVRQITGPISPKSVVASGRGVVFAQNMIYNHTVTVYDPDGNLRATIPDTVDLAAFGIAGHPPGKLRGGPVEAAFAPDGRYAWVTNYSMYGPGFSREGHDSCSPSSGYDASFVYRIDVATLTVDKVVPVGTVPKYVAVSPDGRLVLVTNWCTYDLSVIDAVSGTEVKRLKMGGSYPRGIAIDPSSTTAYVAVMGGRDIVTVDLRTFTTGRIAGVGGAPRHLVLSPDGSQLYVTLNGDGVVARVDVASRRVTARVRTGSQPRSMDISADGRSLYVVNYASSTVSKVDTATMAVTQSVGTNQHPIGITYDRLTGRVWVACYSGTIEVFDET